MGRDLKETRTGGEGGRFPSTHWSIILEAQGQAPERIRKHLEALISAYWKPVYRYIRARWGKSNEEAKDLTQDFFLQFLERSFIDKVSPERGRFRTFLKHALKCFLVTEHEKRKAQKRGGGKPLALLDLSTAKVERLLPPAPDKSPEELFDEEWARVVLNRALEAVRAYLEDSGRRAYLSAFELHYLTTPARGYKEIADEIRRSVSDVRNYLTFCRQLMTKSLRSEVRRYVAEKDEIDEELGFILRTSSAFLPAPQRS